MAEKMRPIYDYSVLYHLGVIESSFPRNKGVKAALGMVRDVVNSAPTVSPDEVRGKGEWIKAHDDTVWWWECSVCHEPPLQRYKYDSLSNFCPNCGARMTEVSEDA